MKSNRPVYSKSLTGNYWASFVEKALAKHYGTYAALEGGQAVESMICLTGGCVERVGLDGTSPDQVFEVLKKGAGHKLSGCRHRGQGQQGAGP